MLTRLTVRNFKRFEEIAIDLDSPVLFIGPNNSGKTTALQALALWDLGMRRWNEKRGGKDAPGQRPGVTVNRRDLVAVPMPGAKHLWRNLHVRDVRRLDGKQETHNVRIDVVVDGETGGTRWTAGLEFDYANEESFYCRPLRRDAQGKQRMNLPEQAAGVRVAYLPPMSGLAADETRLDAGAVAVRVGEGRTAEVLRNLCFLILQASEEEWQRIVEQIQSMFGVQLQAPQYIRERGEITMAYTEGDVRFDLTAAGRGLQQTLLLLAYLTLNPDSVLVLDEPDAHLEVFRQKQTYALLATAASKSSSQIIMASHSEVLLQQAVGRDAVVAFVGQPHRIVRGSQVQKALRDIGYADYEQARVTGFVLYLEGTTDFAALKELAKRTEHNAALRALDAAFVRPVGNQPMEAHRHFFGLREAEPRLRGFALFDRLERGLPDMEGLPAQTWQRREIENYLSSEATLLAWAEAAGPASDTPDLFSQANGERRRRAMAEAIQRVRAAAAVLRPGLDPGSVDAKASDDFLAPVFHEFFTILGEARRMPKKRFHELAPFVPDADLDPEVGEKLDFIATAYAGVTDSGTEGR